MRAAALQVLFKGSAIGHLSVLAKKPRTRRIVKIENRRLREGVGGAPARWMQWISINLCRAAVMGRNDEWNRAVATLHGCGVEERFTGNRPLRAFCKRNQVRFGSATTVEAQPSEGHRCAHQFQETSSRPFVAIDLGGPGGKLALEPLAKLRRVAQLAHTAPVFFSGERLRRL